MYLDLWDTSPPGDGFTTFSFNGEANFDVRRTEDDEPILVRLCGREFQAGRKVNLHLTDDEARALRDELITFFANDTIARKYPVKTV